MTPITSGPAMAAAQTVLQSVNQASAKARAFLIHRADLHKAAVAAGETEFLEDPTEARLQHWLAEIANTEAAHATSTRVGMIIDQREKEALLEKGPRVAQAATEEALASLWQIEARMEQVGSTTQSLQRAAEKRRRLTGILDRAATNPGWALAELAQIVGKD